MSAEPLTCPYCNAFVQPPRQGSVAVDHRIACPRCGELFTPPSDWYEGQPQPIGPDPEAIAGDTPMSPLEKPRGRNRLVGLALLGLMVVTAGGGLAYALLTVDFRAHYTGHSHSNKRLPIPTEPAVLPDAGPVAPGKLDALAYLPADTNLIVGVHLAEIGDTAAGQALLAQPIPLSPGVSVKIDDLLRWPGFRREDVDHLVIGIKIDEPPPLPPRMELVLHTTAAHDADAVRKRLKATRDSDDGKRRIDTFPLEKPRFSAALWCVDDRHTFAFGLVPSDVAACPPRPRRDLGQLPREIREVLEERVASGGPLWIAGMADDWTKTWAANLFANMKPDDRARLYRVRTFAAWVQFDQTLTVRADFNCREDKNAQHLEAYFRHLGKEENPEMKTAVSEGWLTLQWRTRLETILQALER